MSPTPAGTADPPQDISSTSVGPPREGTFDYVLTTGKDTHAYQLTIQGLGNGKYEHRIARPAPSPVIYTTYLVRSDGFYKLNQGYRGSFTGGCTFDPPVLQHTWRLRKAQRWSVTTNCPENGRDSPKRFDFEVTSIDTRQSGPPSVTIHEYSRHPNGTNDECNKTSRFDQAHGLLLDEVTECPGIRTHRRLVSRP